MNEDQGMSNDDAQMLDYYLGETWNSEITEDEINKMYKEYCDDKERNQVDF